MWCPTFVPPELASWVLRHLLEAQVRINVEAHQRGYRLPPLYTSGVRYEREPRGQERWLSAPWIYELGAGDCEDLACARAAELRLAGLPAFAIPKAPTARVGGGKLYHIIVDRTGGELEDPSRRLGM